MKVCLLIITTMHFQTFNNILCGNFKRSANATFLSRVISYFYKITYHYPHNLLSHIEKNLCHSKRIISSVLFQQMSVFFLKTTWTDIQTDGRTDILSVQEYLGCKNHYYYILIQQRWTQLTFQLQRIFANKRGKTSSKVNKCIVLFIF